MHGSLRRRTAGSTMIERASFVCVQIKFKQLSRCNNSDLFYRTIVKIRVHVPVIL